MRTDHPSGWFSIDVWVATPQQQVCTLNGYLKLRLCLEWAALQAFPGAAGLFVQQPGRARHQTPRNGGCILIAAVRAFDLEC